MKRALTMSLSLVLTAGCGEATVVVEEGINDDETNLLQQGLVVCNQHSDTGYRNGQAFAITVITVDGKPVEVGTGRAYVAMQQAAAGAGVGLRIVSGFRTMAEQQYLYSCYVNCNCNACTLAAYPGTSNHQSGSALDLNTSAGGVLGWLNAHGASFGFHRTVPSEPWHWEWNGSGPQADICGASGGGASDCNAACGAYGCACVDGACNGGFCPGTGCTQAEKDACGAYGCNCVDHQCNGGFCDGTGCTARETLNCGAFGVNCVDHQCAGGFGPGTGCTARETLNCGNYGCGCVDHKCNGGFCPGTGCTARQAQDCQAKSMSCGGGTCH